MRIVVLGSSAGGSFPQWNCNCNNCKRLRLGTIKAFSRTQSSIAIELESKKWILINASPDIHHQMMSCKINSHAEVVRENPFEGIILCDSQLDHTVGLLLLREDKKLNIYATENVLNDLNSEFPILKVLSHYCDIEQNIIQLENNKGFQVKNVSDIQFRAFSIKSNAPPYSKRRNNPDPGDNIALLISDLKTGKSLFYAPGLEVVTKELLEIMQNVDCILVDGTVWDDDELIRRGIGTAKARSMGHLPLSGDMGMLSYLEQLSKPRKILVHINNTNPILDEESNENAELVKLRIEVGFDGMEILL